VAGQRDPRGDAYVVTREFEVEPGRSLDMTIDLTVPATEVPPCAGTADFANLLPNTTGGVSSALPPRGKPGIVISFDPALPVTLQAFKAVQQLHEEYGKKGLYVLGVARTDVNAARSFALKNGITFTVACKPGTKADALGALNPENYGYLVVYDKQGSIVFHKARPRTADIRELNRRVAALLN
jgi:peroxiredoxin